MILLLLALVQSTPEPPPGLLFGFYRMIAFEQRVKDLRCNSPERGAADAEFASLRKRLIEAYGKQPFSPKPPPSAGAGDCGVAVSVYRVNLADFRREAEAALATAPSGQTTPE